MPIFNDRSHNNVVSAWIVQDCHDFLYCLLFYFSLLHQEKGKNMAEQGNYEAIQDMTKLVLGVYIVLELDSVRFCCH